MSLFRLAAPCPLFRPCDGMSDYATLQFQRAAHLLAGSHIGVNAAGETVLSFVDVGSYLGELQPAGGTFVRLVHGQVAQIDALFYVLGNPDVQVGDRCVVSNAAMEIISTQQYGLEHCEVSLKEIGR